MLYGRGVLTFTLSPASVISTRSSSSLLAKPFDFLDGSIFVCNSHLPSGWMVTWSTDLDVFFRISFTYLADSQPTLKEVVSNTTYSSTAKLSKGAELLHIGQSHVGPCSCSWRYDVASKHWTCRQAIDRQGRSILNVDRGHLSDKTVAVVTISASRDLLTTIRSQFKTRPCDETLTVINDCLLSYASTILQSLHEVCYWHNLYGVQDQIEFLYIRSALHQLYWHNGGNGRSRKENSSIGVTTRLRRQSICHLDIIGVDWYLETQFFRDIHRPCGTWFILQPA